MLVEYLLQVQKAAPVRAGFQSPDLLIMTRSVLHLCCCRLNKHPNTVHGYVSETQQRAERDFLVKYDM